jgi:DNA-binding transcriptional LysR family regulator
MAEALMPAVRDALDRLRAGLEPRSAFEPSRSTRVFNISARDAGAFMIAPSLARRLQDIAPGVRIAWTQLNRGAISTELASGRLDLAIDVPGIRGTDLEREPLMTTPYVCVVSKDHPLSGRQMTFEAFLELRHVVVSSRREGRSYVEEVARSHGARITPVMRLPTYMPALEIVKYTDLALTAPVLLAQSPGLVSHDLPGVFPALDSELYWRRENSEDAALTWLRALILDAVTELAG